MRHTWRVWTAVDSLRLKKIVNSFRAAGAISPSTAQPLDQMYCPLSRPFYQLMEAGTIVPVKNGQHYLNVDIADQFIQKRKRAIRLRAFIVLAVLALLAIVYKCFS